MPDISNEMYKTKEVRNTNKKDQNFNHSVSVKCVPLSL